MPTVVLQDVDRARYEQALEQAVDAFARVMAFDVSTAEERAKVLDTLTATLCVSYFTKHGEDRFFDFLAWAFDLFQLHGPRLQALESGELAALVARVPEFPRKVPT
jgi:hypothetical protein